MCFTPSYTFLTCSLHRMQVHPEGTRSVPRGDHCSDDRANGCGVGTCGGALGSPNTSRRRSFVRTGPSLVPLCYALEVFPATRGNVCPSPGVDYGHVCPTTSSCVQLNGMSLLSIIIVTCETCSMVLTPLPIRSIGRVCGTGSR